LRAAWSAGIFLLVALCIGCRPKSGPMLVAYVRGDIDLPNMEAEFWPICKTQECYLASQTSFPLDKKGDLLLCGIKAQVAWNESWLRSDIKANLYDNSLHQTVHFNGIGHGGGHGYPFRWFCTRMQSAIECK
jgi:hypothetical protein